MLFRSLGADTENLVLTGAANISGVGNGLNNLLRGNAGANILLDAGGNDMLEGQGGNDTLLDLLGKNYLNGFGGADSLTGGSGSDILIGGTGNDAINTGNGADIIAFNRGDGSDTVAVSTTQDNSVSLGGGIRYADLYFQRSANNLVLKTAGAAGAEGLTFSNWYQAGANRSVLNLQVITQASADFNAASSDPTRNKKVEEFNFAGLVTQFDAARAANPGITHWALANALASFHLGGYDSEALGGDLAYQYGLNGNLAAVGTTGAQNVLADAQLGVAREVFQTPANLQSGVLRLS